MQTTNATFPYLINTSYGGFGFSPKAIELYKERAPKPAPKEEHSSDSEYDSFDFDIDDNLRSDPIMIQIVKELKAEANGIHANLTIVNIRTKYKNHFYVDEYDGFEHIEYSVSRYKLDTIKEVLSSSLSSDDKLNQIDQIIISEQ